MVLLMLRGFPRVFQFLLLLNSTPNSNFFLGTELFHAFPVMVLAQHTFLLTILHTVTVFSLESFQTVTVVFAWRLFDANGVILTWISWAALIVTI